MQSHALDQQEIDDLNQRIRAATTIQEIDALARRPRWREYVYRHLDPSILDTPTLRRYASDRSMVLRFALLSNERLTPEQFTDALEHSISPLDTPEMIEEWVGLLLQHTLPAFRHIARDVLRKIARGESGVLPPSCSRDVALGLLRIDQDLPAEEIERIVKGHMDDESVLLAALEHPNASTQVYRDALAFIESYCRSGIWRSGIVHLFFVQTSLRNDPAVREFVLTNGPVNWLVYLAPEASPEEAKRIIERLRRSSEPGSKDVEAEIAGLLPEQALTPEIRALLLTHPDREIRLSLISHLAKKPAQEVNEPAAPQRIQSRG